MTEFEVITMIWTNKLKAAFYNIEGEPEIWRNEDRHKSMVRFADHLNEFFKTKLGWFWPLKWNHACFDLLFHEST